MVCEQCGKDSARLTYVHVEGKLIGGCPTCMAGKNPSRLSTDKRWYHGQGYDFTASPAHIDHIKHRKLADDGRSVKQCRK